MPITPFGTATPPRTAAAAAARPNRRRLGLTTATAAGTAVVWALAAGTAAAHIEPDPATVTAGEAVTVGFTVEHGCDGSPTTSMRFQVPAGVTDAQPVAKDGWTVQADASTITFSGGSVPDHTLEAFAISFTVPGGVTSLSFPVIQGCEVGEEPWIAIPTPGGAEPDNPAPTLTVQPGSGSATSASVPGISAASTVATTASTSSTSTTTATGSGPASTGTEVSADAGTTTVASTAEDAASSDDGGSDAGPLVIGGIGVIAVVTGVVMLIRRRR